MKKLFFTAILMSLLSCSKHSSTSAYVAMVVGTYTDTGSNGVYSLVFDQENGTFTILDSIKAINPSYVIFSEDGSKLYCVNEVENNEAGVSAIDFDKTTGGFAYINGEPTGSGAPCYLSTNGKLLVAANYGGGSMAVFPLSSEGNILPIDTLYYGSMGGPDSIRQEAPHVHCAEFSVDGKYLYASDFSADRILCFEVVNDGTKIVPMIDESGEQISIPVVPDYGPRHIIFDKNGKHAYVIGELSGFITVFDYQDGKLIQKQVVDGDPYDGRGSADIHLSPDGRFLYTSNRLKGDGITVFSVDDQTGELTEKGYQLTGPHPRHFNITPNGKYMLVACRDSNEIEVYQRDIDTGLLSPTENKINILKPVCVQFIK